MKNKPDEKLSIATIFENDDVLIVDKPALSLSVPSRLGSMEPRPCVLTVLCEERNMKLLPVHRLDFEVSGLLCFAKTTSAHQILNENFETRQIEKEYEALTERRNDLSVGQEFEWMQNIHRGKKRSYEAPFGKEAVTIARIEKTVEIGGKDFFYWKLKPITGRSHQLRVALTAQGVTILGDELYGNTSAHFTLPGIALRAIHLQFPEVAGIAALGTIQAESFLNKLIA